MRVERHNILSTISDDTLAAFLQILSAMTDRYVI